MLLDVGSCCVGGLFVTLLVVSYRWWFRFQVRYADRCLPLKSLPPFDALTDEYIMKWRNRIQERIGDPITQHGRKQVLRFARDQILTPPTPERLIQLGYNMAMLSAIATNSFRFENAEENVAGKHFFWDGFAHFAQQQAWGSFALLMEARCEQLGLQTNCPSRLLLLPDINSEKRKTH